MLRNDERPLGMLPHNYSPQIDNIAKALEQAQKEADNICAKKKELERIERAKEKSSDQKKEVAKALLYLVIGVLLTKLADYIFK